MLQVTPTVGTVLWVGIIAALFALTRDDSSATSKVLWIPLVWAFIVGSRPLSMWLGLTPILYSQGSYEAASPVDTAAITTLLFAALLVVARRRDRVGPLLRKNLPVMLLFLFCGISLCWSEYPWVAFKRWSKAIGDLAMVLVILTEADPLRAVKRLVTWLGFLLFPLSVLFVKYYPSLGRLLAGDVQMTFTGVTIQKNALGEMCMLYGIGFLWMFQAAYYDRTSASRRRCLLSYGAILLMAVWLLWLCNSVTSIVGFTTAGVVMFCLSRPKVRKNRALIHWLVLAVLGVWLFAMFVGPGDALVGAFGRNGTLSGRTVIWSLVLGIPINPLIGTGFESFWLGNRLAQMRSVGFSFPINEAHNGYLEVYLNLGWVGVALLAVLLVSGYRNIISALRQDPEIGTLLLGIFLAVICESLTETAFRMMSTPWIFLLLAFMTASQAKWRRSGCAEWVAPPSVYTGAASGVHQ